MDNILNIHLYGIQSSGEHVSFKITVSRPIRAGSNEHAGWVCNVDIRPIHKKPSQIRAYNELSCYCWAIASVLCSLNGFMKKGGRIFDEVGREMKPEELSLSLERLSAGFNW